MGSLSKYAWDHQYNLADENTPTRGAYIAKGSDEVVEVDLTEGKALVERLKTVHTVAVFILHPTRQVSSGWDSKTVRDPEWRGATSKPHPYRKAQYSKTEPEMQTVHGKADTLDALVEDLMGKRREAFKALEEMTPAKELANRLKYHDWYYQMADDGRAYRAGQASWSRIRSLLGSLPPEEARVVWAENAPEGRSCPV